MASMDFVREDGIKARLQTLVDAKQQALQAAGASVLAETQAAFVNSGPGINNDPWAPFKRKPKPDHKLLWKTGTLFRSITMQQTDENTVEIGSNVKYAIFQNAGTKFIPARPFLFLDDDRMTLATKAFYGVLQQVVNNVSVQ